MEMLTENLVVITPDEAPERLASPAPVLISEHEVALATAIALQPRPKPRGRWVKANQALVAAVQRALTPATGERPARRDYPRRYAFLENACMAREMERL
jgi:hypothetical protein